MISPVTANSSCGPFFDYSTVYNFHGRVIVASDDLHLPLQGESVKIPETNATIHSYRTDIGTDKAFPWKGYSSYGWDHDINTVQNGKVYFKLETCTFDDDTRYWYFHLDPPVGYIPASAHPLNVYGTAIDSQTIFYDEDGLPGGNYEFLFQVKRDPKCLEPEFFVNIPQSGDAPPQDVFFTASSVNNNLCGPLPIVTYQWQSYEWDFGDSGSAPAQGIEVIHTYQNAGDYNVKLTVTDASGFKKSKSQRISHEN